MADSFISRNRNTWIAYALTGCVLSMIGLAYAAVPLYQLFCSATGYGGTTREAKDNPKGVIDRQVTVRFDASVDNGLAWKISPAKPVTDKIGAVETINFVATNLTDHAITGKAIYNVSPEIAGSYFNKIECFCFTQQTLQAGETVQMPVVFFVDPDMDQNQDMDTIKDITLSYTFYASDNEGS